MLYQRYRRVTLLTTSLLDHPERPSGEHRMVELARRETPHQGTPVMDQWNRLPNQRYKIGGTTMASLRNER